MKAYCLGVPPSVAGIYTLVHKTTGHVYVGQTTDLARRMREWRAALGSGFGHTNSEMFEALKLYPDLDQWYFVVDKELPFADATTLRTAEHEEIERRRAIPSFTVLNVDISTKVVSTTAAQHGAVLLRTDEGGYVGQKKAAAMIGRNEGTVSDKVKWLKGMGVKEILVSDLLKDRRTILAEYIGNKNDILTT